VKVQKEIELLRRMADLLEENEILRVSQSQPIFESEEKSGGMFGGVFIWTIIGSAAMFGYVYLQGGL
jgi:hypothetical protein|tara:strand:+ start:27409 stop:27609 length:201 start_codon:yes stop_codon:yes gene_type:complete